MTASSERRAFLSQIREVPEDDTARLVYADWLEEHGEPERAEFIRVQVEMAKLPPKPRELFVADGGGKMLEGLGVALIPRGDGHYSASNAELGLSIETFAPNERVDVYAHLARGDRVGWLRGLRYVRTVADRNEIIFRKDSESGPWVGVTLAVRERKLLQTGLNPDLPNIANADIFFGKQRSGFPLYNECRVEMNNVLVPGFNLCANEGQYYFLVRRGFIEALSTYARAWLMDHEHILTKHPVQKVALRTSPTWSEMEAIAKEVGVDWVPSASETSSIRVLNARWKGVTFTVPEF